MKITWTFTEHEVADVRDVVNTQIARNRPTVQQRQSRNIDLPWTSNITQESLWHALVLGFVTTQQASGTGSNVSQFMEAKPFTLTYAACKEVEALGGISSLESFVNDTLLRVKVGRRKKVVPAVIDAIKRLEAGEWVAYKRYADQLLSQRLQSCTTTHYQLEREAAEYLLVFKEIGPKQSRNIWQYLGLTRYAGVFDSRVTQWLRSQLSSDLVVLNASVLMENRFRPGGM
ncbi:MAG: hypothetical protein HUU31_14495 [Anaerolineae bacterium]|nr:hypothetical protein [Anaerolineae bacterium]